MGSVARTISKPFEWVGHAASNVISSTFGSVMKALSPKIPDFPKSSPYYMPPEPPAEPAGPGASASESSEAQKERLRVLAAKARKKTKTMLTSAQGLQEAAGVVKKKLLGE